MESTENWFEHHTSCDVLASTVCLIKLPREPVCLCKILMVHCDNYYRFLVRPWKSSIMAACLRTVKHNQASFPKNSSPIYVHCVSEDNFPIDSVSFHLCEADLSQSWVGACCARWKQDWRHIYEGGESPAVIRIIFSCDTEVRK